jgi:hypothetical protein
MSDRSHTTGATPEERDPKSGTTLIVGAVGVILLAVVIILLQVLFYRTAEAERWRKVVSQQPEELRRLHAEQLEQINGYRWVDEPNGVVAIPVDRAMDLVIQESRETGGGTAR